MQARSLLLGAFVVLCGAPFAVLACSGSSSDDGPATGDSPDAEAADAQPKPAPTPTPTTTSTPDGSTPAATTITADAAHDICNITKPVLSTWLAAHCSAADKARPEYAKYTAVPAPGKCEAELLAAAASKRIAYDPAKLAQCKQFLATTAATAPTFAELTTTVAAVSYTAAYDVCPDAVVGLVPSGGACASPRECVAGLTCFGYDDFLTDGGVVDGTCKPPAAIGAACGEKTGAVQSLERGTTAHPTCVAGAFCSTVSRKCETLLAAGGDCYDPNVCAAGLRCQNRKCATTGPDDVNATCRSGVLDCKPGLQCTSNGLADGTCATKQSAGPAASCNPALNGLNECAGLCVKPATGPNECVAFCGAP